jgi:hypothetical protein
MAITKHAGEPFGIRHIDIDHQGEARSIHLWVVLAKRKTGSHQNPVTVPSSQRFTLALALPYSPQTTTTRFSDQQVGSWPSGLTGTYDVNLSIGPLTPSDFNAWYSVRYDDDWDDDVYKTGVDNSSSINNQQWF